MHKVSTSPIDAANTGHFSQRGNKGSPGLNLLQCYAVQFQRGKMGLNRPSVDHLLERGERLPFAWRSIAQHSGQPSIVKPICGKNFKRDLERFGRDRNCLRLLQDLIEKRRVSSSA
jgi:hypothetical protein